jgi:hypothetical protein
VKKSYHLYLVILGMWFALTCFVDFIAVPTVFREISSRAEAGNIGMILFALINKVEFIFALSLIICAYFFKELIKRKKIFVVTLTSLLILVGVYNLYMTPQVVEQTMLMRDLEENSVSYKQAEERHQFFHSLYRKTDGVKILVLLTLMIVGIAKTDEKDIV